MAATSAGGRTSSRSALALLALVILVVVWFLVGPSPYEKQSPPASQSPPAQAPTQSAADQARSISSLLADAKDSRLALVSAVADVDGCRDSQGAISTLSRVAKERQNELSRAYRLTVDQLPNGEQLQQALEQAFSASLTADQRFLAWAQTVAGCSGTAPHTENYQTAAQASQQATAAKQNFVSMWNSVAGSYLLPTVREQDI